MSDRGSKRVRAHQTLLKSEQSTSVRRGSLRWVIESFFGWILDFWIFQTQKRFWEKLSYHPPQPLYRLLNSFFAGCNFSSLLRSTKRVSTFFFSSHQIYLSCLLRSTERASLPLRLSLSHHLLLILLVSFAQHQKRFLTITPLSLPTSSFYHIVLLLGRSDAFTAASCV